MKQRFFLFVWLFILHMSLLGCRQAIPVHDVVVPSPIATTLPTKTPTTPLLPTPIATPTPPWSAPIEPYSALVRAPLTDGQRQTAVQLSTLMIPPRDSIELAMRYRGLTERPSRTVANITSLTVGAQTRFTIPNTESNAVEPVLAVLAHTSEHAYFWFDETVPLPDTVVLNEVGEQFDAVYQTVRFYLGQESTPGVDGDPRLHILHVSPERLCVVVSACGVAGFFSLSNLLPASVDSNSNERELLIMNHLIFASPDYMNVLGHEFRHLIEANYDLAEQTWVVEGTAVLAEHLLGYPATERANAFMQAPDLPLHDWTTGDLTAHYGQAYLLNLYLYQRLGADSYRTFANHPADGLAALQAITGQSQELWRDWLVALALHGEAVTIPAMYMLPELQLRPIEKIALPMGEEQTVYQETADFYTLPSNSTVTFTGSTHVSTIGVHPPSGQTMWLAGRGNFSHATLTRRVDLRAVQTAVLHYNIYVDLQMGRDFAHLVISTDEGETWQPLAAPQMQTSVAETAFTALTPSFYTGQSGGWLTEQVDLTPYAGQEILLRFELLTDPILLFDGVALDQIAIPEIGFYDDGEAEGWQADGFVVAHSYLPQTWSLTQLILHEDGTVHIVPLLLDETQQIMVQTDSRPSWLIVGAFAPQTRKPATYLLSR